MDAPLSTLEQIRKTAIDLGLRFGPKLLAASSLSLPAWVGRLLARGLNWLELEPPVSALLTRIGRGIVLALFVIMSLQNLGVQLLSLIEGLSVIGAGAALAMQGV
jgi:small conductance mechanosensitive channel